MSDQLHTLAILCLRKRLVVMYSSSNIVRVIKLRGMRWSGHVARMGEVRGVYGGLGGETRGKETTGET